MCVEDVACGRGTMILQTLLDDACVCACWEDGGDDIKRCMMMARRENISCVKGGGKGEIWKFFNTNISDSIFGYLKHLLKLCGYLRFESRLILDQRFTNSIFFFLQGQFKIQLIQKKNNG